MAGSNDAFPSTVVLLAIFLAASTSCVGDTKPSEYGTGLENVGWGDLSARILPWIAMMFQFPYCTERKLCTLLGPRTTCDAFS